MNILVLLAVVYDSESVMYIKGKDVIVDNPAFIINPFDEQALEEAIRLREKHGGKVTILTVGTEDFLPKLRYALAMGADKAVLLKQPDYLKNANSATISQTLQSYIKEQRWDLIFAGTFTIDGGTGAVGPRIAALNQIPYITNIRKIDKEKDEIQILRLQANVEEEIRLTYPLLVTIPQGFNTPRLPSVAGIVKAKKKPLEIIQTSIPSTKNSNPSISILNRTIPIKEKKRTILTGDVTIQVKEVIEVIQKQTERKKNS